MTTAAIGTPIPRAAGLPRGIIVWIAVFALVVASLALQEEWRWLNQWPQQWSAPLADWINVFTAAAIPVIQPVTRAFSAALEYPMRGLQQLIQWLPWPGVSALIVMTAFLARGWKLALFAALSCLYVLMAGYWRQTMNTTALVLVSIPLAVLPGFLIGALAQRVPATRKTIEACLDIMQTMPAFAYLIPLLLLFGFGPVVGLIASAIFAIPPMVRNTWLGLDMVPEAVREAGTMSGCTPWQRFFLVDVPNALPQLMVGVNQTTMAALSMVIIATIIGGFQDIGWEVLSATRMAQLGHALLSGFVIALMAILIDRITKGFAERSLAATRGKPRRGAWAVVAAALLIVAAAAALRYYDPSSAILDFGRNKLIPEEPIDHMVLHLVAGHAAAVAAVKNDMLIFVLLPLKVGLRQAVIPQFWGFGLTPALVLAYTAGLAAIALAGMRLWGWKAVPAVAAIGLILYFGVAGFAWPGFIAIVTVFAWRAGGAGAGLFALSSLLFMLLTGLWGPATLAIYLCAIAVLLCLVIGGAIGLWAAASDRVSAIVGPINDALQTMPQFVFLIPAVMFFKVGDIPALMAVMLYAIVPPIRYVEHGLRHVRPDVVEAARQVGCTPAQLLWHVKVPLAMPVILLGVNQTIMAGLSMLAIAAMVGTRGLGQQVYIALGKADAGLGLVAGLSIALLAMMSDRIIRAWLARNIGDADA